MRTNLNQFDKKYKIQSRLCLFFILLITCVSFSSALNNGFVNWDDPEHLLENPIIRSLDWGHISEIFKGNNVNAYRPLTILSFAIEYHFFKFNPFIYHLDNLLLHLGVTGLVFFFALQVGLPLRAAGLAALVFGIHPMRVESVAWVTERKDVLYAFFYMAALCQYWRYLQNNRRRTYSSTIILTLLSVLAKPMAISLPLIFFLCDWLHKRKFSLLVIIEKIPYFVFIIPIALKTVAAYKIPALPGTFESILIWVWTLTFYIQKFLFPFILIPLYKLPRPVTLLNFNYLLPCIILLLVAILCIRYRSRRWWVFSCLFYFISIFWLLKYTDADANIVADRYMYLPSLGFCLFVGLSCHSILSSVKKRTAKIAAALCVSILLSLLAIKTFHLNKIWRNSFTLWNYVVTHSPESAIAYNNLGVFFNDQGDGQRAMENYNKAIAVDPFHFSAIHNRGALYEKTNNIDSALEDYARCIAIAPREELCYIARAMLYMKKGLTEHAFADFNIAVSLNPNNAKSLRRRADAFQSVGNNHLAIIDYNAALSSTPNEAVLYNNRGMLYTSKNLLDPALSDFNKAVELDPRYSLAYYNRSFVYQKLNQYGKAIADIQKAKLLGMEINETRIRKLEAFVLSR